MTNPYNVNAPATHDEAAIAEVYAKTKAAREEYDVHMFWLEHPPSTTKPAAPCGTTAGEKRHRKDGESICDACLAAKRKYDRDRYARRKTR